MNQQERRRAALDLLTLPAPAKDGRARLIDTAMALYYFHGINAIGLDRVLAEAGVSKTTFYKHFESRSELIVAAIEARDAWHMDTWKRSVEILVGAAPRDQLMGLVELLDIALNEPSFRGCQFINAAAEFPNPSDPIHRAAARHKLGMHSWVRELAEEAGAHDPMAFADAYTILFEGTLVLRQVHDRDDAAQAVRPQIKRLLDEFIPAP